MKPSFLKRFMKKHALARCAYHFGQSFLADLRYNSFGFPFLPNRAKSKSTRASLFSLELKS